MKFGVVSAHQLLNVLISVGLMLQSVMLEMQDDRSAQALDLAVGLQMISRSGQMFHADGQ